jgi:hypothetical protein
MDYTHGSHWECVINDVKEFFENNLDNIIRSSIISDNYIENGYNLADENIIDNNIHILQYQENENDLIVLTSILINKTFWTAYPSLNYGYKQDIIIDKIHDIGNLVEGLISCHLAQYPDFTFTFFDTQYYKNKLKYEIGDRYSFAFAGYAYGLNESTIKNEYIDIDEEKISLEGMSMFIANENGYLDDYKINSKVLKVENFTLLNNPMKSVVIKALNTVEETFEFPIFVANHNIKDDYNITVGNDISGGIWMTGILNEDTEDDKR